MKDILVRCTRCTFRHMESERVQKVRKTNIAVSDLVCPRCGCKSYFDMRPQVAWCWASGLIQIGDAVPADSASGGGAIVIATGPKVFLESTLSAVARHGYGASEGLLLVPGVPEVDGQDAKADALADWLAWCAKRNGKNGVMFTTEKKGAAA